MKSLFDEYFEVGVLVSNVKIVLMLVVNIIDNISNTIIMSFVLMRNENNISKCRDYLTSFKLRQWDLSASCINFIFYYLFYFYQINEMTAKVLIKRIRK